MKAIGDHKTCSKCRQHKHVSMYFNNRRSNDGLSFYCKVCQSIANEGTKRRYIINNRAKILSTKQRYRLENADKIRSDGRKYARSLGGRYASLKDQAKRRKIKMLLTLDEYARVIADAQCAYCCGPLPEAGSGLDRINNHGAYELSNVNPCCADCNYTRGDRFTAEEMIKYIGPAIKSVRLAR